MTADRNVKRRRRRRRRRNRRSILPVILVIIIAALAVLAVSLILARTGDQTPEETVLQEDSRSVPEYPEVVSSATIGSTGDILMHMPVLDAFYTGYGYDFTPAFMYIEEYYKNVDLMVANLEVPLVDPYDGYEYSSNPFASPDEIADALRSAGVDVCLTANNHSYDMGRYGLIRTQQVLDEKGIDHVGTRESEDEPFVLIENVNGIKIGMVCYTYDTGGGSYFEKSLNYIPLDDADAALVNSFNYSDLEKLYSDAAEQVQYMETAGCDVKIFYLHWGNEYEDYPDGDQTEIARQLCEAGADIIVGGHPHVIQMFDVLESSSGKQTICLYSTGNELSNQRRDLIGEDGFRGYTEDGVVFTVKIDKLNNGKVKISGVDILPTWVQKGDSYRIIPLDRKIDPYEWPSFDPDSAIESYNRTLGRLGEKYISYREQLGQESIPTEITG